MTGVAVHYEVRDHRRTALRIGVDHTVFTQAVERHLDPADRAVDHRAPCTADRVALVAAKHHSAISDAYARWVSSRLENVDAGGGESLLELAMERLQHLVSASGAATRLPARSRRTELRRGRTDRRLALRRDEV